MTVGELIEKLKDVDPDVEVWIADEHGDETEIVGVDVIGIAALTGHRHARILEGKVWR